MKNLSNMITHIVSTYLSLLSKKGSSKISVQDVCQCAFVSRRTFYNHFNSIEQLADCVCMYLISETENASEDFAAFVNHLFDRSIYIKELLAAGYFENMHGYLAAAIEGMAHTSKSQKNLASSAIAFLLLECLRGRKDYALNDIITLYHGFFGI